MQHDASARSASVVKTAADGRAGEPLAPDICVIGAGSGGLTVAAAAAALGRKVVLIEKHRMGGDSLNYGSVPSKALLAAANRAHMLRTCAPFGIAPVEPAIDHAAVQAHVQSVIAAIAPNASVERFAGLGVRVIQGAARFADKRTVTAGDYRIAARRFVIATGSSPIVPLIAGLENVPYFTNETIIDNTRKLDHLIVVGAGSVGLELAQAHHRLGSRVTVLESERALARDDPELSAVLLARLRADGITIAEGVKIERIEPGRNRVRAYVTLGGRTEQLDGTHLLLAVGRRPNTGELNLEAAGIKHDHGGIRVDRSLRTSNRRVFAIGDVTGGPQYTHVSNYHASIVIRRALFGLPAKVDNGIVPWVTFTDPELAHVGLTEEQATKSGIAVNVLRWPYYENDRAQAERVTDGHIKVVTDRKGRIAGATIVGHAAGELIQIWSLAIAQGLKIASMTDWISPYPTLGEIGRRVATRSLTAAPSNPLVRKAISILSRMG